MNDPKKIAEHGVSALLKAGANKAHCRLVRTERHELNVASGEMSLWRTTFDDQVLLLAIKDNRKASVTLNKSDPEAISRAAEEVLAMTQGAQPDEANDIAENQPPASFSVGQATPDREAMHRLMREHLEDTSTRYPKVLLMQAILEFVRQDSYLVNSNGVDLSARKGVYRFTSVFSAKENERVSSFNGIQVSLRDLRLPLSEAGSVDRLYREISEQVHTRPVPDKFTGDVIIAPDSLEDFLNFLTLSIKDRALISGTSVYKNSLNQVIASPLLNLYSRPVSDEIADGYFFTADGYPAKNSTIVDRGVLLTFLLSLYGSNKVGQKRAVNDGEAYVVGAGATPLEEMVKSVERGIILVRFSGGNPSDNGDLSGVAKNSYYIEGGEIRYPISETMISCNIADVLRNIEAVSREQVNYGTKVFPWVKVSRVTISGK